MLEITHNDFEPGEKPKKLWTYVRKEKRTVSGVTLPGLFGIRYFGFDAPMFVLIVVLELWGLANLLYVGQFQIIYMAGAFLADFVFAIFHHVFSMGKTCVLENKIVIAHLLAREAVCGKKTAWVKPEDKEKAIDGEAKRLEKEFRRTVTFRKVMAQVFAISIFLLAAAKVFLFYGLQDSFDGLTVTILLSYIIVAILHVKVTGYFFFAVLAQIFLWIDEHRFIKGGQFALEPNVPNWRGIIKTDAELTELRVGEHAIVNTQTGQYAFLTHGMLTDDELSGLIRDQRSDRAKRDVALHGLRRQINILETNPTPS